jgi:hypothetical protein
MMIVLLLNVLSYTLTALTAHRQIGAQGNTELLLFVAEAYRLNTTRKCVQCYRCVCCAVTPCVWQLQCVIVQQLQYARIIVM